MAPLVLPTDEGYDRWSEIYDSEGNPLIFLEEPQVQALLQDVRGLAIADVGCGTGRHAVRLAQAGARVTALDFSSGMLDKARAKPGAGSVTFVQHDLGKKLPLADEAFDRVLCCLVLDHIADLEALFGELRRICKRDGYIVISVMHPAMMLRGVEARFRDPSTGQEIRPRSVANSISDYVMAAVASALSIEDMSEHAVSAELVKTVPRAERYLGWPMLLMMKLRRG
jgi:ubiquinone/menaquinone biosynthesis C-methylase UbiE